MPTFKMNGKRGEPLSVECYLCKRRMNSDSFFHHCKSRKHNKILHDAKGLARFWIKVSGSSSVFLKEDIIRSIFEKQGKIQKIVLKNGAFFVRYLKIKNTLTALDSAYRGDYKNVVNLKLKVEPVYVSPSQPMEVDVFDIEPENNALDDFRNILSHTIRSIQSTPTQSQSFESIANQIVSSILSYAQNESGSNQVYSDLTLMFRAWCASVQHELRLNVRVQLYVFGSVEIGLALSRFSDIDVYIDVGNTYLDMLHETTRLLFQHSDKFHDIVSIKGARVPIVKAVHSQSDIPIDISFKSKLGWYNTQLIKFYVKYDARVKTLLALIKIWFKRVELNDTRAFTSYSIYWLGLFYLQQLDPPLIPSVRQLMQYFPSTQCLRWKVMHSEEVLRTNKEYPPSQNSLSLEKLLLGFFQFYAELDLKDIVICPLLGKTLPRSVFEPENIDQLPRAMDGYYRYAQEFPKDTLRISSQMCVQDPYDLSHNITKAVNHASLSLLVHHLETVWIMYKRNPSQVLLSLLEDVNEERDALLREFDVENETLRLQRLLAACKKAREKKDARERENRGEIGERIGNGEVDSSSSNGSPSARDRGDSAPNRTSPSSDQETSSRLSKLDNTQTSSANCGNQTKCDSSKNPVENKSESTTSATGNENSSNSNACSEQTDVNSNSRDHCQQISSSAQKSVSSCTDSGSCASLNQQKNNFDSVGLSFEASTQKRPACTSKQKSTSDASTSSRQQKTANYSSESNEQKFDGRGRKSPDRGARTLVITNSNKLGSPGVRLGRCDRPNRETSESRISTHNKDSNHLSSMGRSEKTKSSGEKPNSDSSGKAERDVPTNRNSGTTNAPTFSEIVSSSVKKSITPAQSDSKSGDSMTTKTDSNPKNDSNTNRQIRHGTSEQGATSNSHGQKGNNATNTTTVAQSTHRRNDGNIPSHSPGCSSVQNIAKEEMNLAMSNSTSTLSNNIQSSPPSQSNAHPNTGTEGTSQTQSPPRDIHSLPLPDKVNEHPPISPLLQMFYNLAKPSADGTPSCVPTTTHVHQQLQLNQQHLQRHLERLQQTSSIVQVSPQPQLPPQTSRTSPPGFPPMFPVPHPVNVAAYPLHAAGPPGIPVNIPGPPNMPAHLLENAGHRVHNMFSVPINTMFASGTSGIPLFPVGSHLGNPLVGGGIENSMSPGTPANSTIIPGSAGNASIANPVGTPPGFLGNLSNPAAGNSSSVFPGTSSRFPAPSAGTPSSVAGSPQSSSSSSSSSFLEALQRMAINSPQNKLNASDLLAKNVTNIENQLLGNMSSLSCNSPNTYQSVNSNDSFNNASTITKSTNIPFSNVNVNSNTHNINSISLHPNSNPFSNFQINSSSPSSVNGHHSTSSNNLVDSTNRQNLVNNDLNIEAKLQNLKQMIGTISSQNGGIVPLRQLKSETHNIAYINVNDLENNLRKKESSDNSKDSLTSLTMLSESAEEPLSRSSSSQNTSNSNTETKTTSGHSRDSTSQTKNTSGHSKDSSPSNAKDTSRNPRTSQMKPHSSSQIGHSRSINNIHRTLRPSSIQRTKESSNRNTSSRNDAWNYRNASEKYHHRNISEKPHHIETNYKSSSNFSRNTRSEHEKYLPARETELRSNRTESSQTNTKDRRSTENEMRKESSSRNTSKSNHWENSKVPTREVPSREIENNVPMVNGHRDSYHPQRRFSGDTYHIQTDHKRNVIICIQEPHSIPHEVNFFNIANEVLVEYLEQVCLLRVNTKVYATEAEFLYCGEHGTDVCHKRKKLLKEAGFNPPRALNHSKFQVEILKTNFLLMNARKALVKNTFVVSLVSRLVSQRGEREVQVSLVNENRREEMSQYLSFLAFVQNGFDVIHKEIRTRCQVRSE